MSIKDFKNRKSLLSTIKIWGHMAKGHNSKGEGAIPCKKCGELNRAEDLRENYFTYPHCFSYLPLTGKERFDLLLDEGYEMVNFGSKKTNPINFPNYRKGEKDPTMEAVKIAKGHIFGSPVWVASMIDHYMLGSLGTYVGEEITRMIEAAEATQTPIIIVSLSGGARMQEGMFSLMQMAKITAALSSFGKRGGLYISLLTNPTMGGVSASFAAQGDFNIAEPGALIGFAGPRVIRETLHEQLPDNFQQAENLIRFGFLDMILERKHQREVLGKIVRMHGRTYGRL